MNEVKKIGISKVVKINGWKIGGKVKDASGGNELRNTSEDNDDDEYMYLLVSVLKIEEIQPKTLLMESLRVARQPYDNRQATNVFHKVSESPECSVLTLSMVLNAASVAGANQALVLKFEED